MHCIIVAVLVIAPCVLAHGGHVRGLSEGGSIAYLERFGYLDELGGPRRHHAPDNVQRALREFQAMSALPVTGRLDAQTVARMRQPRCGYPDVIRPSQRPENTSDSSAPLAYALRGGKWNKDLITWEIKSFTKKLSRAQIHRTIHDALGYWANVTNLSFKDH